MVFTRMILSLHFFTQCFWNCVHSSAGSAFKVQHQPHTALDSNVNFSSHHSGSGGGDSPAWTGLTQLNPVLTVESQSLTWGAGDGLTDQAETQKLLERVCVTFFTTDMKRQQRSFETCEILWISRHGLKKLKLLVKFPEIQRGGENAVKENYSRRC